MDINDGPGGYCRLLGEWLGKWWLLYSFKSIIVDNIIISTSLLLQYLFHEQLLIMSYYLILKSGTLGWWQYESVDWWSWKWDSKTVNFYLTYSKDSMLKMGGMHGGLQQVSVMIQRFTYGKRLGISVLALSLLSLITYQV